MGIARATNVIRSRGNLRIAGFVPGVAAADRIVFLRGGGVAPVRWALLSHASIVGPTVTLDTTGATILIASVSATGNTGITDNRGNTWVVYNNSAANNSISYCINPSSVGPGHQVTGTGYYPTTTFAALSGSATFDRASNATGVATSSMRPGPVTPSQANALLFASAKTNSGSFTITDDFEIIEVRPYGVGVNYGGALAWRTQTVSGVRDPVWSSPGITDCTIIAFV